MRHSMRFMAKKEKKLYFILFNPLPIKHANTVMTIFGFTSTKSSGKAYIQAPIFRAIEIAYLGKKKGKKYSFSIICIGSIPNYDSLVTFVFANGTIIFLHSFLQSCNLHAISHSR